MSSEYTNWIKSLLTEKFGIDLDDIKSSSYFEDDLNMGEMEVLELLEDLEDKLKIDLIEDRDNIETIQDLIDIIEERID